MKTKTVNTERGMLAQWWLAKEEQKLATELCDGDLKAILFKEQPYKLNFLNKIKITQDLVAAVLYTHENGYTHGDIKPTNLLVKANLNQYFLNYWELLKKMTKVGVNAAPANAPKKQAKIMMRNCHSKC